MNVLRVIRRFLVDTKAVVITTELVLWTAIFTFGITAGIVAVRFAVTEVFLDSAESLANREPYTFRTDPLAIGTSKLTTGSIFGNHDFPGTDSGGFEPSPAEHEGGP